MHGNGTKQEVYPGERSAVDMIALKTGDIETLQRLEEDLWREDTRFDIAYMKQLIAEDFIEVGRSGRTYDRESILAVQSQPIGAVIPLPNFKVRALSDSVVQVTYDSHIIEKDKIAYTHRSSIWSRESDGWKLRFHQGTPYEPSS